MNAWEERDAERQWYVMFGVSGRITAVNTPTGEYIDYHVTAYKNGTFYREAHVEAESEDEAIEKARAVVRGRGEALDTIDLTELHVGRLVSGEYQAMLTTGSGEWGAADQPVGFGKTPMAAILNAIGKVTENVHD